MPQLAKEKPNHLKAKEESETATKTQSQNWKERQARIEKVMQQWRRATPTANGESGLVVAWKWPGSGLGCRGVFAARPSASPDLDRIFRVAIKLQSVYYIILYSTIRKRCDTESIDDTEYSIYKWW